MFGNRNMIDVALLAEAYLLLAIQLSERIDDFNWIDREQAEVLIADQVEAASAR